MHSASAPATTTHPPEVLSGQVERVTFQSEETGFSVLKVKAKGFRDLVPVVGVMPNVTAGEWIEATGRWMVDREHGQQFKVDGIKTTRPDTLEGIERYLGSGLIKGIGPHFAKKMVERFGADVFDIIEQDPDRLKEVDGIGKVRREKITSAWHDQKAIREIMVFLHSHGLCGAPHKPCYADFPIMRSGGELLTLKAVNELLTRPIYRLHWECLEMLF